MIKNLEENKKEKLKTGFVKVSGPDRIWIPPFAEADVPVTGPSWGKDAVIEPLSVAVEGNLTVASTLVAAGCQPTTEVASTHR